MNASNIARSHLNSVSPISTESKSNNKLKIFFQKLKLPKKSLYKKEGHKELSQFKVERLPANMDTGNPYHDSLHISNNHNLSSFYTGCANLFDNSTYGIPSGFPEWEMNKYSYNNDYAHISTSSNYRPSGSKVVTHNIDQLFDDYNNYPFFITEDPIVKASSLNVLKHSDCGSLSNIDSDSDSCSESICTVESEKAHKSKTDKINVLSGHSPLPKGRGFHSMDNGLILRASANTDHSLKFQGFNRTLLDEQNRKLLIGIKLPKEKELVRYVSNYLIDGKLDLADKIFITYSPIIRKFFTHPSIKRDFLKSLDFNSDSALRMFCSVNQTSRKQSISVIDCNINKNLILAGEQIYRFFSKETIHERIKLALISCYNDISVITKNDLVNYICFRLTFKGMIQNPLDSSIYILPAESGVLLIYPSLMKDRVDTNSYKETTLIAINNLGFGVERYTKYIEELKCSIGSDRFCLFKNISDILNSSCFINLLDHFAEYSFKEVLIEKYINNDIKKTESKSVFEVDTKIKYKTYGHI